MLSPTAIASYARRALPFMLCAAVAGAAYVVTAMVTDHGVRTAESRPIAQRAPSGRQLLVILIGSAACRFSADPRVGKAYWAIVESEKNRAADSVSVTAVGIAVDNSADDGLESLRHVGAFDEYMVGNGWLGNGAVRYVLREAAGPAVVPQVLVVSRPFKRSPALFVGSDSLHVRLTGVDAILRWAARVEAP